MKKNLHLHFVGVGGIGMSGIAEVFLNQGYKVSGSDLSDGDNARRLGSLGAKIYLGHAASHCTGANVVVISSAVKADNPEVVEARRLGIPVIPRAEMLGELMRGKTAVAVAGTHGKTTTTSMIATVLTVAGLDPTLVIGGKVDSLGGNAKLGQGSLVVAEADESDGSFLHLPATYGVITNIDNDHLDHYGSLAAVDEAFTQFVAKMPFYGFTAVCADDPGVRRVLARFTKPVVTYGWHDAEFTARVLKSDTGVTRFEVRHKGKLLGEIHLAVPGKHNVLNALAAVAVCVAGLGVPFDRVQAGLGQFAGVKRRFEVRWRDAKRNSVIVDDYGHHPTEVAATLEAARAFWPGRIVVLFQPHRYSRTLHCKDGFLSAFRHAQTVLIADIYAAGEEPIPGVSGASLAQNIQAVAGSGQEVEYVGALENARDALLSKMRDGDLILCLGAGSITRMPEMLVAAIEATGLHARN